MRFINKQSNLQLQSHVTIFWYFPSWRLHLWKLPKKVRILSLYQKNFSAMDFWTGPTIFSPVLNAFLQFPNMEKLPGSVNQIKSNNFWYAEHWTVNHLFIFLQQIIIPNHNIPGDVDFGCCPGLLFKELYNRARNHTKRGRIYWMCVITIRGVFVSCDVMRCVM